MGWRERLRAGQGHLASERLYLCVAWGTIPVSATGQRRNDARALTARQTDLSAPGLTTPSAPTARPPLAG